MRDMLYSNQEHLSVQNIKELGLLHTEYNLNFLLAAYSKNNYNIEQKREIASSIGRQEDNDKITVKTKCNVDEFDYYSKYKLDAEEYIKTITEGDKSELYHIYHLNGDKKAQDEKTGDQVAYIVDSMSFEYLIKIEYSDLIDGEMNTDYFRVITGVGYGNNFNTGVKAIDLENSENAKLRDVLEGDNIIEIPYDQDNLDLDNGLKTLQRLLINASVAGALEENTSETKTESVIP